MSAYRGRSLADRTGRRRSLYWTAGQEGSERSILGVSRVDDASSGAGFDVELYKYDGSNLRFEWSRRQGWYKFGTRYTVFDGSSRQWGHAVDLFLHAYGDDLQRVFRDQASYRGIERATAYCEHLTPRHGGYCRRAAPAASPGIRQPAGTWALQAG